MTKAALIYGRVKIDDAIYQFGHLVRDLQEIEEEARINQIDDRRETRVVPAMCAIQSIEKAIANLEAAKTYLEELRNAVTG